MKGFVVSNESEELDDHSSSHEFEIDQERNIRAAEKAEKAERAKRKRSS
jgi:hypothetical protein